MPKPARPANVAALWLGIQAIWGAVLAISLQARTTELAGGDAIATLGYIVAIGAGAAAVVQIVSGVLSDRRRAAGFGRNEFYIVGTLLGAIGVAWFYLAPTIVELTIGFATLQLGLNVATGAYQAIVPDTIQPHRTGEASAWLAGMQSAGNAIGAIAATLIAQTRWLAATLVALLIATCAITVAHVRGRALQPTEPVVRATPIGNFANLFASRLLLYAGFYTLLVYVRFVVSDLLASASTAQVTFADGIVVLSFTLCGVLGALCVAKVTDRSDKRAVVSIGGALFAACAVGLPFATSLDALIAVAVVAGAGWGMVLAADWALACRVLPPGSMATSMAVWNLAILLAQMGAPLLVTVLFHLMASEGPFALHRIYTVAGIEVALGILWIWRLPRGFARE